GAVVVAPLIYKNVGYDPVKAFTPIAALFSIPQMLVVNPAVPVKSVQELVAYAKINPRKISFPSPGYGTQPHLLGEMFKLTAGIDIIHIPYKGPAAAITDLLAGQVQMYFENIGLLLPHIETGKLRALAVADDARDPQLPNVPTMAESSLPQLQATYWSGIVAPAGTPASIVSRLNTEINAIMKAKEMETILSKLSARPKVGSPEDLSSFIAAELQKWPAVATAAPIKVHRVPDGRVPRPGNVLHHHLLIKDLTQPRGQKPSDHVERAACGERDDHRNRTRRPFLRTGGRDCDNQRCEGDNDPDARHRCPF